MQAIELQLIHTENGNWLCSKATCNPMQIHAVRWGHMGAKASSGGLPKAELHLVQLRPHYRDEITPLFRGRWSVIKCQC